MNFILCIILLSFIFSEGEGNSSEEVDIHEDPRRCLNCYYNGTIGKPLLEKNEDYACVYGVDGAKYFKLHLARCKSFSKDPKGIPGACVATVEINRTTATYEVHRTCSFIVDFNEPQAQHDCSVIPVNQEECYCSNPECNSGSFAHALGLPPDVDTTSTSTAPNHNVGRGIFATNSCGNNIILHYSLGLLQFVHLWT